MNLSYKNVWLSLIVRGASGAYKNTIWNLRIKYLNINVSLSTWTSLRIWKKGNKYTMHQLGKQICLLLHNKKVDNQLSYFLSHTYKGFVVFFTPNIYFSIYILKEDISLCVSHEITWLMVTRGIKNFLGFIFNSSWKKFWRNCSISVYNYIIQKVFKKSSVTLYHIYRHYSDRPTLQNIDA